MDTLHSIGFLVFSTISYWLYRRFTRISIAHIPGPEPESFFLGNYPEYFMSQAAEVDFKWQAQYGDIIRLSGPLAGDHLFISDPMAIRYIFQTSGYNFQKQPEGRELSRIVNGRGLTYAEGDTHKRHRKILLPGFSGPAAKACTPIFFTYVSKLAGKWRETISATADQSSVFNIHFSISRATLDAIGKVAFDYEFGTMENDDNALGKAYANLIMDTLGTPTRSQLFARRCIGSFPQFVRELIGDHVPDPTLKRVRFMSKLAIDLAKQMVEKKSEEPLKGKENRDIMSLLVRANASENEETKLNEEELLAQMRTIMTAGHETVAITLSWMFLEMSRNPDIQKKLRSEIRSMEQILHARGDSEFRPADFDAMPYLDAFVKESLRYHPILPAIFRQAVKDDILPLSKPVITTSGESLTALPIPKGLRVTLSVCAYNRNKGLFGEDSHTFDPERWLDKRVKKSTTVGVVGNLLTFSGGVRSCIGWKLAMIEVQAFLVELVSSFEFELTPEARTIRKELAGPMVPTVEGQLKKGIQLPLRVRIASREDV